MFNHLTDVAYHNMDLVQKKKIHSIDGTWCCSELSSWQKRNFLMLFAGDGASRFFLIWKWIHQAVYFLKLKPVFLKITVFLRPQRNLESIDPQFTIRRKMEQMREERELVEQLREVCERWYNSANRTYILCVLWESCRNMIIF